LLLVTAGAEANEASLKLARRYWVQKGTPKPTVVTTKGSFHGRTMTTVTASGQPKLHEGFDPLSPGFRYAEFNDVESLEAAVTEDVGAILLEPVLGEGGVAVPSEDYLAKVRALCDARDVLLILDEVQTGFGRTGRLFAYMHSGITPDIMSVAKALGNGLPIGAMGCTEEVTSGFAVGSHGCTFGGNPLCSAGALACVKALIEPGFIEDAAEVGAYFLEGLKGLKAAGAPIQEVRGKGLMIGVEMEKPVSALIGAIIDDGVICGPAGPKVVRFLPPLIVTRAEVDIAVSAFEKAVGAF